MAAVGAAASTAVGVEVADSTEVAVVAAAITAVLLLTAAVPAPVEGCTAAHGAARTIIPAPPITIPVPPIAIPVLPPVGPIAQWAAVLATPTARAIALASRLLRARISAHLARIQLAGTTVVLLPLPATAALPPRRTWGAVGRRIPLLDPRHAAARIPALSRITPAGRLLLQTQAARAVPRRSPQLLATAAPVARPPFPTAARSPTSNIRISAAPRRQLQAQGRLAATPRHLISATQRSATRTSALLAR